MLNPDHRNHLNRFRSTLWEVHPITKIEVWKENQWVDVDKRSRRKCTLAVLPWRNTGWTYQNLRPWQRL
jgi:hypothetical protein